MFKYLTPFRAIQKRPMSTAASVINNWKASLASHVDESYDTLSGSQLNLMANTVDDPLTNYKQDRIPPNGTVVPPAWHLIYFPPRFTESELALDGYELNFKPPKPFVHRMWAGARLEWSRDNLLRVGQQATMKSKLADVQLNEGRRGESAFVWIDKDIHNEHGWSMRESRCLVYVQEPTDGGDKAKPPKRLKVNKAPEFSFRFDPTPMTLFRYSALTFNSHLIHYDHNYATNVEHHPDLLRQHLSSVKFDRLPHIQSFQYRCLSPVYVDHPFNVCGREVSSGDTQKSFELWIADRDNNMAVKGTAKVQL
ncbi:hypothetical protein NQZ79_g1016 [Umbelopsis isabellina]|nr:hypothetical protein NQZ79_g1016 [Umbelopsis isabellina]